MSVSSFWRKEVKTTGIAGTPGSTPSSSAIDLEASGDRSLLDISRLSGSNSGSATLLAGDLLKQPSVRNRLGLLPSSWQKRFFLLTETTFAYKDKESDSKFKAVWKLGTELLKVEGPKSEEREFAITVLEKNLERVVKFQTLDGESAKRWAKAIDAALLQVSAPAVLDHVSLVSTNIVVEPILASNAAPLKEMNDDDLVLKDVEAPPVLDQVVEKEEEVVVVVSSPPRVEVEMNAEEEKESAAAALDQANNEECLLDVVNHDRRAQDLEAIESLDRQPLLQQQQQQSKGGLSSWFWGACCVAE